MTPAPTGDAGIVTLRPNHCRRTAHSAEPPLPHAPTLACDKRRAQSVPAARGDDKDACLARSPAPVTGVTGRQPLART
jgi:hypothetical protein